MCSSDLFVFPPLLKTVFNHTGKAVIDGTSHDFLKVFLDFQYSLPTVNGCGVCTVPDGNIYEPLFQQTEAGGQGQSIAELNQTVIVIIDGIL